MNLQQLLAWSAHLPSYIVFLVCAACACALCRHFSVTDSLIVIYIVFLFCCSRVPDEQQGDGAARHDQLCQEGARVPRLSRGPVNIKITFLYL
jgi:hypothetical protein